MKMAYRLEAMGQPDYRGLTMQTKGGPVWTGVVRAASTAVLEQPMRWKRPRRIFVDSMADLFAEGVEDEWIDRAFAIMALAHWHTFLVLTKRPKRMQAYLAERWQPARAQRIAGLAIPAETSGESRYDQIVRACEPFLGTFRLADPSRDGLWTTDGSCKATSFAWPLPNVWLGTSVERQQEADERIPHLLGCAAAVRFLSCEPLLGPLDLSWTPAPDEGLTEPLAGRGWPSIDWVIVGGESGPGKRPMDLAWARSIRDQCAAAGVAFFGKQNDKVTPLPDDLLVREWPDGRV